MLLVHKWLYWNIVVEEEQYSVVKPGFKRMDLNDTVDSNADLSRQPDHSSELEQSINKLVYLLFSIFCVYPFVFLDNVIFLSVQLKISRVCAIQKWLLNWNVIVEEQSIVKPGFKRMDLNDMVERNADLFGQLSRSADLEQANST